MTKHDHGRGERVSRQSSLSAAKQALRDWPKGTMFRIECTCGWKVREDRRHLAERVAAHFNYADASRSEQVEVFVIE